MRLKITQLKAPWPSGAKVGDIIELPAIPLWAVGKCEDAGGAAVTLIARNSGSGDLQGADDQPARVFVTNPADTQADTGNGSGEALPADDSTVKTGKAQK